jgi:hypothetical protein
LRGTDAEHHSILSGTEQHHQASQYCLLESHASSVDEKPSMWS